MNIFLTGGTGLVGGGILRALLAKGHSVHALARTEVSLLDDLASGSYATG